MSIYGNPLSDFNAADGSTPRRVDGSTPRAVNNTAVSPTSTTSGAVRNSVARNNNSSVNTTNTNLDLTVRIFDDFTGFRLDVPVNEYDVVESFFNKVFGTGDAAAAFANNLFRVAVESNTPVLTLLDQMADLDRIKVTQTLAYYINGTRSPSTLLGVNSAVTPTVWAARNILP